jgi:phosphonate transport system substrate-binding protein
MKKWRLPGHLFFAFLLICLSVLLYPSKASGRETLKFGIHPYLPAEELMERFTPLADLIGKKLGVKVEIVISRSYDEHIQRIGRNELDLAYMGPFSYVQMTSVYGKKPILARLEIDGKPTFTGVIFVLKTSDIQTLSGLKGKRFAFAERESTMGFIVPLYMLSEAGVRLEDFEEYEFITNHNNVALSVLSGDFDAGAIKDETFEKYESKGLRALAHTPEIPEHVFVARTSMKADEVGKLRDILLKVGSNSGEQAILNALKPGVTRLSGADDSDYDYLRQVHRTLKKLKAVP